jgi:2-polyprenyl-3-methyl-5-hydroxy-6-metoxy-1,4-benzoquinol methylase
MSFFKIIPCPICNLKEYLILKKGNYNQYSVEEIKKKFSSSSDTFIDQVVKCLNCKFVYLNPRLDNNIILEGYTNVIDEKFISQDFLRLKTFSQSLKKIKKILNLSNKKILDVGTANGTFVKACLKNNIVAEGIEPNKWLVNLGKKNDNLNLHCGSFEEFNFKKKYDFIFFWDVLEHVFDLNITKSKILNILNKNGYLIINCPDQDSIAQRILKFKWPFYLSVHLYYFNENSLKTFLKKDFTLIKKFPHFQYLELDYVFERASKYFPFLSYFRKFLDFLKIKKLPFKYNMGQTTFIFKKNENYK